MVKCLYSGRLTPKKQRNKHDFPACSPWPTGKAYDSPAKNHNQTVIFSRRPDDESSCLFGAKRKKMKNPAGAQAFFSRNLNFFEVFCGNSWRRQILGFGEVWRLMDSVGLGILEEVQQAV